MSAPRAITLLLVGLIVSLQVLTTLPVGNIGIRISAADLLLPCMLATTALATRHAFGALLPPWGVSMFLLGWTVWLGIAIVLGRFAIGHWEVWAVANRGMGWLVLLGFFTAGWLVGRSFPKAFETIGLRCVFIGAWIGVVCSAIVMVIIRFKVSGIHSVGEGEATLLEQAVGMISGGSRFQGFFVNPNAFGFFLAIALLLQVAFLSSNRILPHRIKTLGLAISVFGLIFTFSRGAWAGAAAGALFLVMRAKLDYRGLASAFGIAIALSIAWSILLAQDVRDVALSMRELARPLDALKDHSVSHRRLLIDQSVDLWLSHPIVGAGVGSFIALNSIPGSPSSSIHSSYLWLLAETGVAGLVLVAGFFAIMFREFLASTRSLADPTFPFAGIAILISMGIVALTMEALYQRHFWFLLGALLANSTRASHHRENL